MNRVRGDLGKDWLISDLTPWSSSDSDTMALEFDNTLTRLLEL